MKSRAANCAMRTPDSAARPACMRFIMPPPVPAAKLLMPDAVEHASPAAVSNLSGERFMTTPAAMAAPTGPTSAVL